MINSHSSQNHNDVKQKVTPDEKKLGATNIFKNTSKPGKPGKADEIAAFLSAQYTFTYNELLDKPFVNGESLSDRISPFIYCDLINNGFRGKELFDNVISREALKSPFHPVKQFLENLDIPKEAGNFDRLHLYFSDKHSVFPKYLKKWMIGAISKLYASGQNPMLVLIGEQGIGKGFFSKWLCPSDDLFLESPIMPDNKDHHIRLTEKWIWEVGELGSTTRRQDVEALKWFLTLSDVIVRRPYDRFDMRKPALSSFVGTLNDDGVGFLSDTTGNRRFRPVWITDIERTYSQHINPQDLWYEAFDAYVNGETINLEQADEEQLNNEILPSCEVENAMEDYVERCFYRGRESYFVTSIDILRTLEYAGYKLRGGKGDNMDLSRTMNALGFEKGKEGNIRGYKGILPFVQEEKTF